MIYIIIIIVCQSFKYQFVVLPAKAETSKAIRSLVYHAVNDHMLLYNVSASTHGRLLCTPFMINKAIRNDRPSLAMTHMLCHNTFS